MRYIKGTGYVETSGAKVCSKREMELKLARVYGQTGDVAAFTRLRIERKAASGQALLDAFYGNKSSNSPLEQTTVLDLFAGKVVKIV